jgi:hypothetical protein
MPTFLIFVYVRVIAKKDIKVNILMRFLFLLDDHQLHHYDAISYYEKEKQKYIGTYSHTFI